MLGSDGVSDLLPSPVGGVVQPIHQLTLVALRVRLFDNCELEALSKAAGERKRWTFLLTADAIGDSWGNGFALESDCHVLMGLVRRLLLESRKGERTRN